MSEEGKVDWNLVANGSFVKLEDGSPKTMLVKNWKPQDKFKDEKTGMIRPGVVFEVWEEDGQIFDETSKKEWTITARGALAQFRPICEEAEQKGSMEAKVTVIAVGEGKNRKYSVKEV